MSKKVSHGPPSSGQSSSITQNSLTSGSIITSSDANAALTNNSEVRRNANGGVYISNEELQSAFSVLDFDKTGYITLANLKKRLGVFYPDMTAKEYRFLMNNKREITLEDLTELLAENEISNFDPIAEAFKVYDEEGTGFISGDKMRKVFSAYGFGELSDEELDILTKTADLDGDGQISIDDFKGMLEDLTSANAAVNSKKAHTRKSSVMTSRTK